MRKENDRKSSTGRGKKVMRMKGILILMLLVLCMFGIQTDAISVSKIVGTSVNGPILVGPGTLTTICGPDNGTTVLCPNFFQEDPTTPGRFFGDSVSVAKTACLVSTNFGGTWSNCPTAYPVTTALREMAVTNLGTLLSLRWTSSAANTCQLDRSTDQGTSWTTITVATGASFTCPVSNSSGFQSPNIQCQGSICIVTVRESTVFALYKSVDDGLTWTKKVGFSQFWVGGDLFFDGVNGAFSFVSGGDDFTTSVDGGETWIVKSGDVASTTGCGGISDVPTSAISTGIGVACYTTGLATFRFLNHTATVAFVPTQPSGFIYNAAGAPRIGRKSSGQVYVFIAATSPTITTRVFVSVDDMVSFIEMSESVGSAGFPFGRTFSIRSASNGNLLVGVDLGTLGRRILKIS